MPPTTQAPAQLSRQDHVNYIWHFPPSIEEQILTSSTIVRATLLSALAGTEAITGDQNEPDTYRAIQELKFTIHEYLKGTGPNTAAVVVRGKQSYLTKAEASREADQAIADRVTKWDSRECVLFLHAVSIPNERTLNAPSGMAQPQSGEGADTFRFTTSNPVVQSEWDYSVDTLSRSWLPSNQSDQPAQQQAPGSDPLRPSQNAGAPMFIIDGSVTPSPVISLNELRAKITEINTLQTEDASEAYQKCVRTMITRERYFRHRPIVAWQQSDEIPSGSAPGDHIHTAYYNDGDQEYFTPWISGPDAAVFQTGIADDDSDPTNGYDYAMTVARPLPAGVYNVFHQIQPWEWVICDFKADNVYDDWTITVTAPEGTLHEALLDPVTIGSAVGVDGSSGSLDPAGFTVDNTAVTITKLLWQADSVTLAMSPHRALVGHSLEFIDIDGAVSLTLNMDDATPDSAAGTLTWTMPQKPWKGADQLMLRINKP